MGLLSEILFGPTYKTKAECDRAIAEQQECIAQCQVYIAQARGQYKGDNLKRMVAYHQSNIAQHKKEIARIKGIKAGLSK